jgi:hypothetical protein
MEPIAYAPCLESKHRPDVVRHCQVMLEDRVAAGPGQRLLNREPGGRIGGMPASETQLLGHLTCKDLGISSSRALAF